MRIGIALAMVVFPEMPFWGTCDTENDIEEDDNFNKLIGIKEDLEETEDATTVIFKLNEQSRNIINDSAEVKADARKNTEVRNIIAKQIMMVIENRDYDIYK